MKTWRKTAQCANLLQSRFKNKEIVYHGQSLFWVCAFYYEEVKDIETRAWKFLLRFLSLIKIVLFNLNKVLGLLKITNYP